MNQKISSVFLWRQLKKLNSFRISLVFAVLLFVLHSYYQNFYSGYRVERVQMPNSTSSAPLKFVPSHFVASSKSTAIFLHGRRCSTEMMQMLAGYLARNGIVTYLFDYAGHGHGLAPMPFYCDQRKIRWGCHPNLSTKELLLPSLLALIQAENLQDKDIYYVGHSSGGKFAHELANMPELSAYSQRVVEIDGVEPELPFSDQRVLTLNTLNNPQAKMINTHYYDSSHLGLLYDLSLYQDLADWINGASGVEAVKASQNDFSLLLPILIVLCAFALSVSLFEWLSSFVPVSIDRHLPKQANGLKYILCVFGVGLFASVSLAYINSYITFFRILNSSQTLHLYYFLFVGLIAIVLFGFLGFDFSNWKKQNENGLNVLFGVLLFLPLLLVADKFLDLYFFHSALTMTRLPRFLFFAIGFLPMAWIIRYPIFMRAELNYFLKIFVWAALCIFWWSFSSDQHYEKELTEFFIGIVFIELLASRIESSKNNHFVSCVFVSCYLAWLSSVVYPYFVPA